MRDSGIKRDLRAHVKVLEEKAKRSGEVDRLKKALEESQKVVEKLRNAHLELKKACSLKIKALKKKLESAKVVASDVKAFPE